MLKNLFGDKAPARTPGGARLCAIGDIHGCADLLDRLIGAIADDEAGSGPMRLIFLGDYVDRGPDSRGVVERLIAIQAERPDAIFLKGNHEAAMLDFLEAPEESAHWLGWGGEETLTSYGVKAPAAREPEKVAKDFRHALPAAHLRFLRALELTRVFGDYLFVHAGVRPGVALDDQKESDLLWIRGEFQNAPPGSRPDKVVVHGHQPLKRPLDAGWRIDVDTGACFTGRLTGVVLEGAERRFIST
ncbi:MAG TPA: metallophosphoesterase family protein [Parvularculaceae bacterium]|nr:metallophosphoesterase family protein [Parvularculaceae bacterium]